MISIKVVMLYLFFGMAWAIFATSDQQTPSNASPSGHEKNITTASLPSDKSNTNLIFLGVDKTKLIARLQTLAPEPTQVRTLHEFKIAIGKVEGDKEKEGDNKTPEGIYITEDIIDGAALPELYGPKAIPIDFPNPIDQLEGKTGYGIWLHGVEDNKRIESAKVTRGCVAFYNQDIMRLARWLKPHNAIVAIGRDIEELNKLEDIQALSSATDQWLKSWAERNIEQYISYYDQRFHHHIGGLEAYKDYKKRVFYSYKDMRIDVNHLRFVTHPKYGVSIMNQDFSGDKRFSSVGRKILYWQKDKNGQYKIVREVFKERLLELFEYGDAEVALLKEDEKGT